MGKKKISKFSEERRRAWRNYHMVQLKSGHTIEVGFEPERAIYQSYYASINSGGHHLGRFTRRELFQLIRRRIAQDVDPGVTDVLKKIGAEL